MYVMTQESDLYIKTFDTSSGIRLVAWILSQLTILCTSPLTQFCTKTNDSLFVFHSHLSVFLTYQISWKHGVIHISKRLLLITVRYSLHKWTETILCWQYQFTVYISPVSHIPEFMKKQKQSYHGVVRTSVWSVSYSGELCNKNCISSTGLRWLSEACSVT